MFYIKIICFSPSDILATEKEMAVMTLLKRISTLIYVYHVPSPDSVLRSSFPKYNTPDGKNFFHLLHFNFFLYKRSSASN